MNYKTISNEYMNTGGGCMVNITTIYELTDHKTLFVMCNEEGGTLTTADYIRGDINTDDILMIDTFDAGTLMPSHENFELFRNCWFEYIKADHKRYQNRARVRFDRLPIDLFDQMTDDYVQWCLTESDGCVETNGDKLYLDDNYEGTTVRAARSLLAYMNHEIDRGVGDDVSEAARERFDELPITFGFGERMIVISNVAPAFQGMMDALQYYIDQQ